MLTHIKIYIDAANPGYIRGCKRYISEQEDYEQIVEYSKKNRITLDNVMDIVPVGFAEHGLSMLHALQSYVSKSDLRIPEDMQDTRRT